jgi:MFS family permease
MLQSITQLPSSIKQYLLITGNYWAFTLTDGALRMLVVLHFYQLGFDALSIAMLFLFYEFFGVITNLFGGWLGARVGLNKTMNIGLSLQVVALSMLLFMGIMPSESWLMVWVMAAQALSGIAKDLNKMSAKSAIKLLLPVNSKNNLHHRSSRLFKWVSLLTGSKNALKGVGFFLGALLLNLIGFDGAVWAMLILLLAALLVSVRFLTHELGKSSFKAKFNQLFAKSRAINVLSAARLFLFASRDVWFVVALPVFLSDYLGWSHWQVGAFMALWIICYGCVQAFTPALTSAFRSALTSSLTSKTTSKNSTAPNHRHAVIWAAMLSFSPLLIALALVLTESFWWQGIWLIVGLGGFGFLFAINSSLHSFLIVHYAREDGVSLDVGFYYMANAMGRLLGTVLSGAVFVYMCSMYSAAIALAACLLVSFLFIVFAALLSLLLPKGSD